MKHERIFLDKTDERVYIDTYIVDEHKTKKAAVLVIPGGGYENVCSDREGEPVALAFLARGLNAFVLHYRVGREGDVYPKQLTDAARAMVCIRSRAEEFHIDPHKVYAVGFSAGGHLAGCLSVMFDTPDVTVPLGVSGTDIRPDAVALCYPVITAMAPTHVWSFNKLCGVSDFSEIPEETRKKFSLEHRVTADTSPTYIWHTVTDTCVPPIGSLLYMEALGKAGVPYMGMMYPQGPHGLALADRTTSDGVATLENPLAAAWVDNFLSFLGTL